MIEFVKNKPVEDKCVDITTSIDSIYYKNVLGALETVAQLQPSKAVVII